MINKIYIVTDLGPGDGGKGGVVHKIANTFRAKMVLKFGGGQGSHGVMTDAGEHFAFSHWGCATLEGIPTEIAPTFVAIPHAILNEAEELRRMGLMNPFDLLKVDPRVLCATPFHQIASRLKELAKRDKPRGTVGTGVGEAYRLWQSEGENYSIRVSDLWNPGILSTKLAKIVALYQVHLIAYRDLSRFLPEDQEEAAKLLDLLYEGDVNYADWYFGECIKLIESGLRLATLEEVLNDYDGVAVAECSHGVLTDAEVGFRPHVSAIRTLPKFVRQSLTGAGFAGKFVNLGITRAYAIRHGAGPLPTYDAELTRSLLPHSHKEANRYQGEVRTGALDFVLLKYAIKMCGGPECFDGICVTCADQIEKNGKWTFATGYDDFDLGFSMQKYCLREEPIKAVELENAHPEVILQNVAWMERSDLIEAICKKFQEELKVPVKMISFGMNDTHKILL